MSRLLVLDSGPLGLITQPKISFEVLAINRWLIRRLRADDRALVPAIVYYEIRRELLRAGKSAGLARLDAFVQAEPRATCISPMKRCDLPRNSGQKLDRRDVPPALHWIWISTSS